MDSIYWRGKVRLFYKTLPEYFRLYLKKLIPCMGALSLRHPHIILFENIAYKVYGTFCLLVFYREACFC